MRGHPQPRPTDRPVVPPPPHGLPDSPVIAEVKARTELWRSLTRLAEKCIELLDGEHAKATVQLLESSDGESVIQRAREAADAPAERVGMASVHSAHQQRVDAAMRVLLTELKGALQPYDIEGGDGIPMRTRRNATAEIDSLLAELDGA